MEDFRLRMMIEQFFDAVLTAEEERRYLALARQGDLEARNVLIERNLRLVAHIMNKS